MLQLVGLLFLGVASLVAVAVLSRIFRLFMPRSRAAPLARAAVAGGVVGALIGAFLIPWLSGTGGETLATRGEVISYFVGIGVIASCGAIGAAYLSARSNK